MGNGSTDMEKYYKENNCYVSKTITFVKIRLLSLKLKAFPERLCFNLDNFLKQLMSLFIYFYYFFKLYSLALYCLSTSTFLCNILSGYKGLLNCQNLLRTGSVGQEVFQHMIILVQILTYLELQV